MELTLVCHGATEAQMGLCIGRSDFALSARGFTAVQQLATTWCDRAPRFLFSSDLRRAHQSAQVFAAGFAVEPLLDARLREIDYGRWDGRPWHDIALSDTARHQHWLNNPVIQETPDGENFADVLRRTGAWLSALLSSTRDGDRVLAIAHPGSIRALLCHATGLPPARATALSIDDACCSCLNWRHGEFELRYVNAARFQPT